jgi:hypothetical protein
MKTRTLQSRVDNPFMRSEKWYNGITLVASKTCMFRLNHRSFELEATRAREGGYNCPNHAEGVSRAHGWPEMRKGRAPSRIPTVPWLQQRTGLTKISGRRGRSSRGGYLEAVVIRQVLARSASQCGIMLPRLLSHLFYGSPSGSKLALSGDMAETAQKKALWGEKGLL